MAFLHKEFAAFWKGEVQTEVFWLAPLPAEPQPPPPPRSVELSSKNEC